MPAPPDSLIGLFQNELFVACQIAREAAQLVMTYYRQPSQVTFKAGDETNPVTDADLATNVFIVEALRRAFPDDAILAEESPPLPARHKKKRLWCVDPIDGTRDFVERGADFAVMIGLAVDGEAKVGVVLQPTSMTLYAGRPGEAFVEHGAHSRTVLNLGPRAGKNETPRLVISRRARSQLVEEVSAKLGITERITLGSVGLKVARIAEAAAELYISPSQKTHEWDACAPEAILRAAGGEMTDLSGRALRYNQEDTHTRRGLLASSGPSHAAAVHEIANSLMRRGRTLPSSQNS